MKTWVIILLVSIFVFVIVPLVYFAIIANTINRSDLSSVFNNKPCDNAIKLAKPPIGQEYSCVDGNWTLKNI